MPLNRRPTAAAAARPALPRPAFTLVEVLVATTLTVVVVATLLTLLTSQGRTFERMQGMTALQRDVRLGLSLLPMDLRAASRRDNDLLTLGANEIALNATIGNSMVCAMASMNALGGTIVMPPERMPEATLTSFFSTPRTGDVVKVLIRTEAGGRGDAWLTGRVLDFASPPSGAGASLCNAGPYTNAARHPPARFPRSAVVVIWTPALRPEQLAAVVPGMPLRILRGTRYRLTTGTEGRGYLSYSERNPDGITWGAEEPIAGPYEVASSARGAGIGFAYFDTLGRALAPPATPDQVGRIDVTLRGRTAVRTGGADSVVVRDSALVRVSLRNRL